MVGHAYLDYKLGQRLEQFFNSRVTKPDGSLENSDRDTIGRLLFGQPDEREAIAGSYAVRVSLARVCGLIDTDTCIALRKLNGMRILCAHSPSEFQLTSHAVDEIHKKMNAYWKNVYAGLRSMGAIESFAEVIQAQKWSEARVDFMYIVMTLLQPVQGVPPVTN